MYFRDKRFAEYSHWFTKFLALLRCLSVFIIALLLLSPFVKTIKEDTKRPLIIIASDKSESIAEGEKKENLDTYKQAIDNLENDLNSKFDVKYLTFGSNVHDIKKDSFLDKSTNLSQLFKSVSDNYGDQNLGALIVGSDGIFNEGSNPLYTTYNIHASDLVQMRKILLGIDTHFKNNT